MSERPIEVGDRVKVLTCPGAVWRGKVGTVTAAGYGTLTVRVDGDPNDAFPVHDYTEMFERIDAAREGEKG